MGSSTVATGAARPPSRLRRGLSPRLTAAFSDRFAIIGPPAHCVERLEALVAMGIDRLVVVGPSIDADPVEAKRARQVFAAEVLPALRGR